LYQAVLLLNIIAFGYPAHGQFLPNECQGVEKCVALPVPLDGVSTVAGTVLL